VLAACGWASVQATEVNAGLVACAVHAPVLRDTKDWLLTYVIHHVLAKDTCTGTCTLLQPAYWPSGQEGGYELDWKELWTRKKERVMVSPIYT
jgi:hypothetical protein